MDTLTINWREQIISLFPDATTRTKREHDEWCSVCNGLGLINQGNCVVVCIACNGKGFKGSCECGKKIGRSNYDTCDDCREKERKEKQFKREQELFQAATKISFKDYTGFYLWNDRAINKDDLEEEIYSLIYDGEEPPAYIWGTKKNKVFGNIDLAEVVTDKCEDGYEDMSTYFDFKDDGFVKAQELVNDWLLRHDSVTDIYYDDYKTVVILDDLIESIKAEIHK